MSETTAEERAILLRRCNCTIEIDSEGNVVHEEGCAIRRLIADVEQAEAQRDKLRDKLLEIAKGNCGSFQHDIPTFLAGLSTVTPECERVSQCCDSPATSGCVTHHGPWPSGTDRCPAAMAGNVTA